MIWLTVAFGFAGLLSCGLIYQALQAARDRRIHPAPGRLIDVGGHALHLTCSGLGGPTVLLESGVAASSISWSAVQPELAKLTRVCAYDRAGLGWSESGPRPRSARQCVLELHALLDRARLRPPLILVGHSFGGLLARLYAAEHPATVGALVLLDPLGAGEWCELDAAQRRMLRGGVALSRCGALLARLGFVRLCLSLLRAGSIRIPRLVGRCFGREASNLLGRMVGEIRKLPPAVWPWAQAHWSQPRSFAAMADYLAALPQSAAETAALSRASSIPTFVLSAGNCPARRLAEHRELARRSAGGRHQIASGSGHWIQLDRPELVVATIREALEALRGAD
ncbi:MAG TPA: alpha/beta hydrolase [Acidobacteriota bacterium]